MYKFLTSLEGGGDQIMITQNMSMLCRHKMVMFRKQKAQSTSKLKNTMLKTKKNFVINHQWSQVVTGGLRCPVAAGAKE